MLSCCHFKSVSSAASIVAQLFPRNHRPVAFPTPPPLPHLGAEVTAQQKQEDTERGDADEQKNCIFYGEHSRNFNRYFANPCTFNPDGKSGEARKAELQPVKVTPTTASTAAARNRLRLQTVLMGG